MTAKRSRHRAQRRVPRLSQKTRQMIGCLFRSFNYRQLGRIYCDEGGGSFWRARRGPCEATGIALAEVLLTRLVRGGRSLYVGAGVAELPMMVTERCELGREVAAFNLRKAEARLLTRACRSCQVPLAIRAADATSARGRFDHLWIVSVLNDPERFPQLAGLAYGYANPATFDTHAFVQERRAVRALTRQCLGKLRVPGLVTTSVEEIPWITEWCTNQKLSCVVEEKDYPTAIVEDPLCFIRIGR
jgi:hypothetical protein